MAEDSNAELEALAVEETVHSIAQRVQALDMRLRGLILEGGHSESTGLDLHRDSIYRIFEWRLRQGVLDSCKLESLIGISLREIERFRVIINNLIGFFSRLEPLRPRRRKERLRVVLEEVVDLFDFAASEKDVDLHLFMVDDPILLFDADLVERLFVNIIDNAVKYSYSTAGSGKRRFISIVAKRHTREGDFAVTISSYGVGILEEEIMSGFIFEYGARGSLAKDRERRGLGIGLAEAKKIVEAHGGGLRVRSDYQHSDTYLTTVQVILPSN